MRATATLNASVLEAVRATRSRTALFHGVDGRLYLEARGDILLRARLPAAVSSGGCCSIDVSHLRAGTIEFDNDTVLMNLHRCPAQQEGYSPDHFTPQDRIAALPLKRIVSLLRWTMSSGIHLAPYGSRLAAYASSRRFAARILLDAPSIPPVTLTAPLVRAIRHLHSKLASLSVDGDQLTVDGGEWQLRSGLKPPQYQRIATLIDECAGEQIPIQLDDVLRLIPWPTYTRSARANVSRFLSNGPLVRHLDGKHYRFDTADRTLVVT